MAAEEFARERMLRMRRHARGLRWFVRAGYLDATAALDKAGWERGGGFALDAPVQIEGRDRAERERRLRYGARPPFALDRLQQVHPQQRVYCLPRPRPDGGTALHLTPLELLDRLAARLSWALLLARLDELLPLLCSRCGGEMASSPSSPSRRRYTLPARVWIRPKTLIHIHTSTVT